MPEVDGVNAGYARLLLDEYLDNPEGVPAEWRSLFETGDATLLRELPGFARLLDRLPVGGNGKDRNGGLQAEAAVAPSPVALPPPAAQPPAVAEPAKNIEHAVAVQSPAPPLSPQPPASAVEPARAPVAPPASAKPEPALAPAPPPAAPDQELLGGVAAAMALIKAHRMHGHLAAHLDPLGSEPVGDPAIDPLRLEPKLTLELQARIPTSLLRIHVDGPTLKEALPKLTETYCGSMGYEMEHIADHEQRVWLRKAIESWRFRTPLAPAEQKRLYARLSEVEGMERYLRRSFLGQKQFSLEGLDVLIPMLDESLELAAAGGAQEVVLGMAHRGRLNVLAHTVGMAYEQILREFEGERTIEVVTADAEGGTGDVKYHLGAEGVRETPNGPIKVKIAANPSHLEAVNPVVEGMTRAVQTDRHSRNGAHNPKIAMPILLHGDAAFAGQGIVAETFNLYALEGYSTGGTLHLITNNQVGFTTDPTQARSTRHSSDLAKGYDTPIIHVNGDDPEAAISSVRLALAYRARFHHDVVIDLVGYRRFGHNEQDEPAYTQPIMAGQIDGHPTVRELYGRKLIAAGILSEDEARELDEAVTAKLRAAHDRLRASFGQAIPAKSPDERVPRGGASTPIETAVPEKRLRRIAERLLEVSDGFTVHPKLEKQLERRLDALDEGAIDWAQAEALAFGSLLRQGVPIRLTGQDSERGTFSNRHLVLHDARTGEIEIPMQNLKGSKASFEVYNSPLSEYSCVGFEYGYSTAAPDALVLWEAQYGDFANGAQTIIDQFISSSLAKWRQTTRLTLLLPHGYEGNGPEHSSARLERFLQLTAQENMRIANCTTSAQYFHLLRRQALDPVARPLIVMTPKGLLRLRAATSALEELSAGGFQPVLDAEVADRGAIRRLVFCTGKVYYDIVGNAAAADAGHVAVARLELLYPFPVEATRELMSAYPQLDEIVWAQEEPQNMGAWRTIRHRLEEASRGVPVRYVGRPWRASTAEGYPTAHSLEQERIALAVFAG